MPEIKQYDFKYSEVLEALIKYAGLRDGKWQLTMSFGLNAANMGPSPEQIVPGAIIGVTGLGLARAVDESPKSLVVDAAVVNPASSAKQPPSGRSRRAAQAT